MSLRLYDCKLSVIGSVTLSTELLQAKHLNIIFAAQNIPSDKKAWFNLMVIKGLLANIESKFKNILRYKNPYCILALQHKKVVGYLVLKPINARRTCWAISNPEIVNQDFTISHREIKLSLIKEAIKIPKEKSVNWLIRFHSTDTANIAITRELGFQPLNISTVWSLDNVNYEIQDNSTNSSPSTLKWENINKNNVVELWRLEQVSESILSRKINDKQSSDLYDQKTSFTGLITTYDTNVPILGLIKQSLSFESKLLKLFRDLAWDDRIGDALALILTNLKNSKKNILLETSNEDKNLNNLLSRYGAKEEIELILLGKNHLNRVQTRSKLSSNLSIKSVLNQLTPKQSPLPSPSLEQRT